MLLVKLKCLDCLNYNYKIILSERDLEILTPVLQCEFCNIFAVVVLRKINLDRLLGKLLEER